MNLKYLITGTGRCGTVFMARLMTSLGIPCGHECIFNNDKNYLERLQNPSLRKTSFCSSNDLKTESPIDSWLGDEQIIAESSYFMTPFLDTKELAKIPLIHVVRNPFEVVSSFVKDFGYFNPNTKLENDDWQSRIYDFLPELNRIHDQVDRGFYFYIKWNEAIEKQSYFRPYIRCKIETILDNEVFFKFINKEKKDTVFTNNKINSLKNRTENFTIKDIKVDSIKRKIVEISRKYKYNPFYVYKA